jgi:hypothetical protein
MYKNGPEKNICTKGEEGRWEWNKWRNKYLQCLLNNIRGIESRKTELVYDARDSWEIRTEF